MTSRPVYWGVFDQHADQAAGRWMLREWAARQPHYRLADLVALDRALAYDLRALARAGRDGGARLAATLATSDVGEVFAAAWVAIELGFQELWDAVDAACEDDDTRLEGAAAAFAWQDLRRALQARERLAKRVSPVGLALQVETSRRLRQDPGVVLVDALRSAHPRCTALAARAAGELGRVDLDDEVAALLDASEAALRFEAARAATLLGWRSGPRALSDFIDDIENVERADDAVTLLARQRRRAGDTAWLAESQRGRLAPRAACKASGAWGIADTVAWLLAQLDDASAARAAGEALSMLTGADLVALDLDAPGPADEAAQSAEEFAVDPDENLPWPRPDAVRTWWLENQARWPRGVALIVGEEIGTEAAERALLQGTQTQRHAAALEFVLANPGSLLHDAAAPTVQVSRASTTLSHNFSLWGQST